MIPVDDNDGCWQWLTLVRKRRISGSTSDVKSAQWMPPIMVENIYYTINGQLLQYILIIDNGHVPWLMLINHLHILTPFTSGKSQLVSHLGCGAQLLHGRGIITLVDQVTVMSLLPFGKPIWKLKITSFNRQACAFKNHSTRKGNMHYKRWMFDFQVSLPEWNAYYHNGFTVPIFTEMVRYGSISQLPISPLT